VATVGLEDLFNEIEAISNDVIPLRGVYPFQRVANIRTSTVHAIEEDLDARVEVKLRY
jgi:hypothetical protein